MGEPKFTPGPWKAFWATGNSHLLVGVGQEETGNGITDSGFGLWGGDSEEARANANLIAAAPELYEALSEARRILHELARGDATASIQTVWAQCIATETKARRVLAKARGES